MKGTAQARKEGFDTTVTRKKGHTAKAGGTCTRSLNLDLERAKAQVTRFAHTRATRAEHLRQPGEVRHERGRSRQMRGQGGTPTALIMTNAQLTKSPITCVCLKAGLRQARA